MQTLTRTGDPRIDERDLLDGPRDRLRAPNADAVAAAAVARGRRLPIPTVNSRIFFDVARNAGAVAVAAARGRRPCSFSCSCSSRIFFFDVERSAPRAAEEARL
eukprot:tig00021108_g18290.t1